MSGVATGDIVMLRSLGLMVSLMAGLAFPALAQPTPQAVPVGVVMAQRQPVARSVDFVGRVEAIERVGLRARVSAFLEEVLFTEGSTVKAGDPMLRLDKAPLQAAMEQTQGALAQASAALTNATLQRARADELVRTNATSVATRDERVAAERSAQGSMIRAQADVKTAAINLGYADITAPITGKVGRVAVTQGNLVGPESGVLATIVSQDPMYVVFPVSQREFLALQKRGEAATDRKSLVVKLRFADGSPYDQDGRIDFVDVSVDRATDTVTVRARVPNPQEHLVDGQFVRVAVQGDKPEEKVVVPQAALIADQEGIYVFVAEGGKAVVKRIKTGGEVGPNVVVESGLAGGEQVVMTGLGLLRPGSPVVANPIPQAARATGG
jgi:membrane fusion protein (multidrug efflux system)